MLEQIVNYIGDVALKHIAVKTFKYQKRIMINQQGNNRMMEVIIEDNPYFQYLKTSNVFTLTLNIDIIGQPKDDREILKIQNDALTVGVNILGYIEGDYTYKGYLSIHDYDFLALSHFTNDNSAGQRITLELVVPNPLDMCTFMENFDEDQMQVEEDNSLDLTNPNPESKADELVLNPIKLPRNK